MNFNQRKIIMKSFINSQFGYCPLVWIFHSRKLNNRINKIHERALRIVFKNMNLSFRELLDKDNSVTIHEKNIQSLAVEMYKQSNEISPKIMNEVFPLKKEIKYHSKTEFETRNVKTEMYGIESLAHLGPKIWAILPKKLKEITSLNIFQQEIKIWKPTKCPCKLCKTYINGVGYID